MPYRQRAEDVLAAFHTDARLGPRAAEAWARLKATAGLRENEVEIGGFPILTIFQKVNVV